MGTTSDFKSRIEQADGGTARIDRLKEEIGWLKVVFGVLVAIDVSLLVVRETEQYGRRI
jgi:hypothetical protein